MKKIILALLVLAFPGHSLAQQIGPGIPAENSPGRIASPTVGVGYGYREADYDGIELKEHRYYLHLGAAFGDEVTHPYEMYLRVGASSLEEEDNGFDGGIEPMYGAGIKSLFYDGDTFGVGGVLQGVYVKSYEDTIQEGNQVYNVSLEDNVDVEVAIPVHTKLDRWVFYGGPIFYWTTADVVAPEISRLEKNIDEDNFLGVFGGVAFKTRILSLELEAKYKSDISLGAFAAFTF